MTKRRNIPTFWQSYSVDHSHLFHFAILRSGLGARYAVVEVAVAETFVVVASAPEFAADGRDALAAAFADADSAGGDGFAGLEGHTAEAEQMSGAGVVVAAAGVDGK